MNINIKHLKCPRCGGKAVANLSTVLTSNPPQYNVSCENCGRIYMLCADVSNAKGKEEVVQETSEHFSDKNLTTINADEGMYHAKISAANVLTLNQ